MKRVITLVLAMALVCALCLSFGLIASADGTPEVSIYSKNVSYADSLHIVYAVKADNIADTDKVDMLFWGNGETAFAEENATVVTAYYKQNVFGNDCFIFESAGIAAREMTDVVYARARVTSGDDKYYSAIDRYSVLEYAVERLADETATDDQIALYNALLTYGAAAQKVLDYKADTLANDAGIRCNITLDGGKFAWGAASALFIKGETVTVTADAPAAFKAFASWNNAADEIVSTDATYSFTANGDIALHAVYACTHDIVNHDAKASTCVEHGWNAYETCSLCDYTTYEELPLAAHDYGKAYTPITDANGLVDGVTVTFAYFKDANTFYAGALSNQILPSADVPTTMTLVAVKGGYAFKLANGKYLGATAVKKLCENDTPYTWTITFTNGVVDISDDYGHMKYNTSSPRFTTYTSGQSAITLLAETVNWIKEVPADCHNTGVAGHFTCTVCQKNFDKDGKELETLEIATLTHIPQDVAEVPAECGKAGTTAGTVCELCGDILTGCEEITALEHDYQDGECINCHEPDPDYAGNVNITVAADSSEDADVSLSSETAVPGNEITFTVDVAEGKAIDKVYANDVEVTAEEGVYTITVTVDTAIKVTTRDMTVDELFDMAGELENNATTTNAYTLTGVITAVNTPYSAQYKNVSVTITIGTNSIQCYRLSGTGADTIAIGDTITATGAFKKYSGNIQLNTPTLDSYTAGTVAITSEGDNATVTVAETAVNGATVTFTVAPATGYEIASVKVYGDVVTAEEGVYSFTVSGPAKIVVETKAAGTKDPVVVASFKPSAPKSATGHVDGTNFTSLTMTSGDYTLTISNGVKIAKDACDAKLNGAFKLGTSSAIASFTITVPTGIDYVEIHIAGYKNNAASFTINGGAAQKTTKLSNNGQYDVIRIAVPSDRTITIATTSAGYRAMISEIAFLVDAE